MSGVMKSLWVCICETSTLRRLVVKQSSLVDIIIELCIKRPGGSIAGTFPDTTFFVLLFIQTLFMVSRSGPTLKLSESS